MIDDDKAIEVLEEYLEKTNGNLESIDVSIGNLKGIASNLTDITNRMRLLLWQMEVLTDLRLLKDIYNLSHTEWMALTTDEMLDLVDKIDEVPDDDR